MQIFENYSDYLHSEHWKNLRSVIHKKSNYGCVICHKSGKRSKSQEVHHINYKNWIDVTEHDLVAVCVSCHRAIHLAIDDGFILQDNKCSLQKTIDGLSRYFVYKKNPANSLQMTKFDENIINKIKLSTENCQKLVYSMLKIPTKIDWDILINQTVSQKDIFRIKNMVLQDAANLHKKTLKTIDGQERAQMQKERAKTRKHSKFKIGVIDSCRNSLGKKPISNAERLDWEESKRQSPFSILKFDNNGIRLNGNK